MTMNIIVRPFMGPSRKKLRVSFQVHANGRVTDVRVTEDSVGDPAVGTCVAGRMERLTVHPPVEAPCRGSFPFVFGQRQSSGR